MSSSRAQQIEHLLMRLRTIDPDIEGTAVTTNEGLVIGASLNENLDKERLSAVCAAVNTTIQRTADELDKGHPSEVIIRAPEGNIFILRAGSSSLLVAITRPSANIGLILIDMRKVGNQIGPILDQ
jgi:predicted regulator of Ras-like GTPase activity (Roadblock/LC7/MglB family)